MSLIEVIRTIASRSVPINEANCITQCILPVLRALGWDDTDATQVQREYAVGRGRLRGRVDIALFGNDHRPVVFIEAKAPRERLDGHVDQVLNHAFLKGVEICVLTTGIEWRLYLPRERGLPEDRCFARWHIKEKPYGKLEGLAEYFKAYLGRKEVLDGSAHERAKQALEERRVREEMRKVLPKLWRDMLKQSDPSLVECIRQRAKAEIKSSPTADEIAQLLRKTKFDVPPTKEKGPGPGPPGPPGPAGRTIKALCKKNPRKHGAHGWRAYNIILNSPNREITYEEYRAALKANNIPGTNNHLNWDLERGFVVLVGDEPKPMRPPCEPCSTENG